MASSVSEDDGEVVQSSTCVLRSLERRPLSNLSVSHPLDSSPGRRALGKEVSFSMKLICVCWKTSRNAKASHFGRGVCGADGEGKDAAKEPDTQRYAPCLSEPSYRNAAGVISPGLPSQALTRQLPQSGSPWQRGVVFDETDLRLPENVTECQSLSLWERCLRSRRRGQGCCQRARHTAIRTLLVRAIVSQRRWSNFTGLALSGADAPAPPKWEPLAKRCRFAEID